MKAVEINKEDEEKTEEEIAEEEAEKEKQRKEKEAEEELEVPVTHFEIEKAYLKFFKKHKHKILESASLVPSEDDPSALFTIAGMHPLKPYILGLREPPSKRLCSSQKCFRTNDIESVGKDGRHNTFFFMLGNWSIGDYFKKEAIAFAYELLTKRFKLDENKLWVTVFAGDKEVPMDRETIELWQKAGIPKDRIIPLGKDDNFWSAGETGPCGPCTEIYVDRGAGRVECDNPECKPGCNCDRFMEIWNLVFMQYNRAKDRKLETLPFNTVDTGMGLERISMIIQDKDSVFETSLFEPIIAKIEELSRKKYKSIPEVTKAMIVIAEHLRAATFVVGDGVTPGKMGREYVLRRILRRAIKYANQIDIDENGIAEIIKLIAEMYSKKYKALKEKKRIVEVIIAEYRKFINTLNDGMRRVENLLKTVKGKVFPGIEAFNLYATYGFPVELTQEILNEYSIKVDMDEYKKEFEKHVEVSKASQEAKFKGGLADQSYASTRYHTATHLLHQALRDMFGKTVEQRGSNITPEKMRFDFSFSRALTPEEQRKVEDKVNEKIKEDLRIIRVETTPEEAKKEGAIGLFSHKYGDKVSVYYIGGVTKPYSVEICMGPHVKRTSELGKFRIIKEQSSSAGVRRIVAILE